MTKKSSCGLLVLIVFLLCPHFVQAAEHELASIDGGSLKLTLIETAEQHFQLKIKPAKADPGLTANVFAVENPVRLVVDIPNVASKVAKSVTIKDSYFTAMRTGIHSDKTRVVLDAADNRTPVYEMIANDRVKEIVIDISVGSQITTRSEETPNKEANQVPNIAGAANQAETQGTKPPAMQRLAATPTVAPEQVKPIPETAKQEYSPEGETSSNLNEKGPSAPTMEGPISGGRTTAEAPTTVASGQEPGILPHRPGSFLVKGIFYQAAKNNNAGSVMIDVEGIKTYSFNQKDSGKFELLLKDCELSGSYLTLPQFPPDTFGGFQVIVAAPAGNDVLVKVYAEEGVKISPFIAQGKLWLKASKGN